MKQPEKVTRAQHTRQGVLIGEYWSGLLPNGDMFLAPCSTFTEAEAQEQYEHDYRAMIQ